jgi:drug/metabolite transporter (DMT)-like permease
VHRLGGQTPIVVAVYATLAATLSGQWIAATIGVTAVPSLELSTIRFAIAATVLGATCAITRTPIPSVLFFWVSYLVPVASRVLAFLILAEQPLPLQLAGAVVIVTASDVGRAGSLCR